MEEGSNPSSYDMISEKIDGQLFGVSSKLLPQKKKKLEEAVVGIAGVSGAGSEIALRLAQMQIGHLMIADDGLVTQASPNYLIGGSLENVGASVSETVAAETQRYAPNIKITSYAAGVDEPVAEELAANCDVIIDQLPIGNMKSKRYLHAALARRHRAQFAFAGYFFGQFVLLAQYSPDGTTFEDAIKIDKDGKVAPYVLLGLWRQIAQTISESKNIEDPLSICMPSGTSSLFPATMSVAAGLVATHVLMTILGEGKGKHTPLTPLPHMYCYDTVNLSGSYITIPN